MLDNKEKDKPKIEIPRERVYNNLYIDVNVKARIQFDEETERYCRCNFCKTVDLYRRIGYDYHCTLFDIPLGSDLDIIEVYRCHECIVETDKRNEWRTK